MGSIEGRVQLEYFDELNGKKGGGGGKPKSFAFKCHRDKNAQDQSSDIYSVNCIAYNAKNTFATAGFNSFMCNIHVYLT